MWWENLSSNHVGAILAVLALLGVCFFLLRRAARGVRRESPPLRGVGSPRRDVAPPGQPLRGEGEKLLVELQEFGREIEGRLETRIQHLTRLIAEADRAIERLNARIQAVESRQAPSRPDTSVRDRILALSEEGRNAADIARALDLPEGEVELVLGLPRE